jgi:hypothetical protein
MEVIGALNYLLSSSHAEAAPGFSTAIDLPTSIVGLESTTKFRDGDIPLLASSTIITWSRSLE